MRWLALRLAFRERDPEIKSGSFDCPNCGKPTYCTHRELQEWRPVFPPIRPAEPLTVYTRCDDCRRSYFSGTAIPFFPAGGPLRSDMKAELRAGGPIEGIRSLLASGGVDAATTDAVVDELVGKIRNLCPTCSLTYLPTVSSCKRCGSPLVKRSMAKPDPFDELA